VPLPWQWERLGEATRTSKSTILTAGGDWPLNCPSCGQHNEEGADFCRHCGSRMALVCPSCQKTLPPDSRFCISCGTPLAAPIVPPASASDPTSFCDGRYQVRRFLGE